MAITVVQTSPTVHLTAAGDITATLANPTGSGNTLVACINANGTTANPVATSATLGGVADHWVQAVANNPAVQSDAQIWYDPNCASGQTSVVVHFGTAGSGTIDEYLTVYEVTGTLVLDKTVSANSSASTTFTSGATGTTVNPNEIFFGALVSASSTLPVATGAGTWTTQGSTGARWQLAGFQVVSATGTATYSGTQASGTYSVAVATFFALPLAGTFPAQPGQTWLRRFHHRQQLQAAAAVAQDVQATAGVAASSVIAPAATAADTAAAGVAASTAVAPAPTAAVTASAGVATVAAVALAATVADTATAGVAVSLGAAPAPVPAHTANAGVAIVGAAALDATVSTIPAVNAPAGVATVSVVANAATVADTANAGVAAVAAVAPAPATAHTANAGVAAVSAVAPAPSTAVTASAGVAIVGAAANAATVNTSGSTNAPAAVAVSSAAAPAPATAHTANAGVAAVLAAAPAPTLAAAANAQAAAALAVARPAAVSFGGAVQNATSAPTVTDPRDGTDSVSGAAHGGSVAAQDTSLGTASGASGAAYTATYAATYTTSAVTFAAAVVSGAASSQSSVSDG